MNAALTEICEISDFVLMIFLYDNNNFIYLYLPFQVIMHLKNPFVNDQWTVF